MKFISRISTLGFILGATLLTTVSAQPAAGQGAGEWDLATYALGSGIDSLMNESRGFCLLPPTTADGVTKARNVTYEIQRVDDFASLLRTLNATAGININAGFGNIKGSLNFSQSFSSTENSIFLVASVSVLYPETIHQFPDLAENW